MKSKIVKTILALAVIATSGIVMLRPAMADDVCGNSNIPSSVQAAAGCDSENAFENVVLNILNAVIGILAVVAVVFVVIGGVNYMTSSGDAGKVAKAKTTIIYALIGLAVCALAGVIVNWAVGVIGGSAT